MKPIDTFISNTALQIQYASSDVSRHKRNYWIGFFTVAIVVCFVSLMQCIARGSNYLILRIAEKQVGEQDMELMANSEQTNHFLLNQTELDLALANNYETFGTARWYLPARTSLSTNKLQSRTEENENTADALTNVHCTIIALDDIREKEIGLGRSWTYPPLGENDVILSTSLADAMNAHIGDSILLRINISQYLTTIPDEAIFQYED